MPDRTWSVCWGRTLLATCVAAVAGAAFAPGAHGACSAPAASGRSVVVVCPAVGAEQSLLVPAGVTRVRVTAVRASGGGGGRAQSSGSGVPGRGAVAVAALPVVPLSTLYVLVGGVGATNHFGLSAGGGFNGGGSGGSRAPAGSLGSESSCSGGGGGGASDVRTCSVGDRSCDTLASRLLAVAAVAALPNRTPTSGVVSAATPAPTAPGRTAVLRLWSGRRWQGRDAQRRGRRR